MMVLDVAHCLRQHCGAIRTARCSKRARFLHPARLRTLYAQQRPRKVLVLSMDARCRVVSWLMSLCSCHRTHLRAWLLVHLLTLAAETAQLTLSRSLDDPRNQYNLLQR